MTCSLDEPVARGVLSQVQADVVAQGWLHTDRSEVYLVVEVSRGVDTRDAERAAWRANLLAQAGVATMPVLSGNG